MKIAAQFVALLAISILAACGGDDGGDAPDARINITPDADTTPPPDAEPQVTCTATDTYGAATAANQQASRDADTNPSQILLAGALNADTAPDLASIELYKGFTVFTDTEIVAGTYTLTADEQSYATCGVCVLIYTDFDGTNFVDSYMPTGGTVTISSVTPNLTGTLSNVTFQHVTIDPDTLATAPAGDGCETSITSMSFDAVVTTNTPAP